MHSNEISPNHCVIVSIDAGTPGPMTPASSAVCESRKVRIKQRYSLVLEVHNKRPGSDDGTQQCGVTEWPTPANIKELQRFLFFANFYRREGSL